MKLLNGKEIIFPSEGKGDYILKDDLIKFLKEYRDNPPKDYNDDVKSIWSATIRYIIIHI